MFKLLSLLVLATVVIDTYGQRFIHPTYRPPPTRGPIIRTARDTGDQEPLWLYQGDVPRAPATGDHPVLPTYIDDVKLDPNRRYARSVDSPSARRSGGGHRTSSSSRNTGPTHPGYNRRNARSISRNNFMPRPSMPRPTGPYNPFPLPGGPRQTYPIYARARRDVSFPGLKQPTHHDVVIPNWNPNVKTQPWQVLKIKAKNTRSPRSVEEVGSQVFRSLRSVEKIQESELRVGRSAEEMSSHQVEALSSQEKVYRSPRSVEEVASRETVFRSPRSVEKIQESELRVGRSAEEMSSHQVEV
ncbi:uncharacterized protein LOC126770326 [Nymphalis io]|uniref:uncharacterized protein LOC126770326 n=1 Tax=Inachis io TaxID=171585 RepID=UPI0021682DD4|nr:uncharacterized protein LOC126770326 [Nymphalis io]